MRGRIGEHPRAVLLVLAGGVALAWQLGASSLFLDEGFTWSEAVPPLGAGAHLVRLLEINPPTYTAALHGWLRLAGTDAEWALRLPSLLGGTVLLAAVAWLATEIAGRRAGLLATGLAILSPLLLLYAQEARLYAVVSPLLVGAGAAGLRATAAARAGRPAGLWLGLAGAGITLALATSYTALSVAVPLLVFLATRRELPACGRAAVVGAAAAVEAALFPLLHDQLAQGHEAGLKAVAGFTARNLLTVAAAPFDARYRVPGLALGLGLLALLAAYAIVARRGAGEHRALLLACALTPVLACVVATLAGHYVLLSRFATFGVPFSLVAVAVAATLVPRPGRLALLGTATVAAIVGWIGSHEPRHYFPDTRGAVARVAADPHPVIELWNPISHVTLDYYYSRYGLTHLSRAPANSPAAQAVLRTGRPVWLLSDRPAPAAAVNGLFASTGYRVLQLRRFTGGVQATLLRPAAGRPRPGG